MMRGATLLHWSRAGARCRFNPWEGCDGRVKFYPKTLYVGRLRATNKVRAFQFLSFLSLSLPLFLSATLTGQAVAGPHAAGRPGQAGQPAGPAPPPPQP